MTKAKIARKSFKRPVDVVATLILQGAWEVARQVKHRDRLMNNGLTTRSECIGSVRRERSIYIAERGFRQADTEHDTLLEAVTALLDHDLGCAHRVIRSRESGSDLTARFEASVSAGTPR